MPIWYRPIPNKPIFHVVYSGHITLHDVLGFFDHFETDFRRFPEFDELCEADKVTSLDFGERDLRSLIALVVALYRRNDCRKRIAFVGEHDTIRSTLDNVVSAFDTGYPGVRCQRFGNRAAACRFLNLPASFSPEQMLH